jgi:hypothetical protein
MTVNSNTSDLTRRVFYDVKFGNFNPAEKNIISISLLKNTGHVFYAIFNDFNITKSNVGVVPTIQSEILPYILPSFMDINSDELIKGDLSILPYRQTVHDKITFVIGDFNTVADNLRIWLYDTDVYEGFNLSVPIEIWGDRIGASWAFIMSLIDYEFNTLPEHSSIPYDLFTLFKSKGIDPYIDRREFYISNTTIKDFNDHSKNSQHSSMFSSCLYHYCHAILTAL